MAIASAAFERAEGMFDQAGPLAHQCASFLHPLPVTIDHLFVLPAIDGALVRFLTKASLAQVTSLADGFQAHIAHVLPTSRAGFGAIHRSQRRARWTAINVGFSVIAERFMGEAALLFQAPCSSGRRDIGDNAAFLAFLQGRAIVIAGVGDRLQCLHSQSLFCRLGHLVKLARIVAVVDDLARSDELVLGIDRDLDVVAGDDMASLRQKPGVCIGGRQLGLAAVLQSIKIGLGLRPPHHQCRELVRNHAAMPAPAIFVAGRMHFFGGVVRRQRLAILLDVMIDTRKLLGQPLLRLDARLARVAMEEGAVDRHELAAQKVEFAQQKYKFPVRRLERRPVIPAEVGDGPVAGRQPPEQPHQLQIALRLSFEATRGADPIKVTVKIGLQQVRRIVAGLSRPDTSSGMPEPELFKIECADIGLNRPNRVISRNIILDASRQKAQLLPARARPIEAIRHKQNRTASRSGSENSCPASQACPPTYEIFAGARWARRACAPLPTLLLEGG